MKQQSVAKERKLHTARAIELQKLLTLQRTWGLELVAHIQTLLNHWKSRDLRLSQIKSLKFLN